MGRRAGDDGALCNCGAQQCQRIGVRWRLGNIELEIAGGGHPWGPQVAISCGMSRGLCKAEVETAQQHRDAMRSPPPTPERTLGQTPIDQDQRNCAMRAGDNQIGPKIRFNEKREIGLPMIEKPVYESWCVQSYELMNGSAWQPQLGNIRGGYRAGCAEHREAFVANAADERNDGKQLADARAVNPGERTGRTRDFALAVAFVETFRMLLPLLEAVREEHRSERRKAYGQQAVDLQCERGSLRHGCYFLALDRRSRRTA